MKKILTLITTICVCISCAVGAFAESGISLPELSDPIISVTQSTIPTIKAGQTGIVEFALENTSFGFASDVSVKISSGSSDIKIDPQYGIIPVGSISVYGKYTVVVPVQTSPTANGQYSIDVTITCKSNKDIFTQQTLSFSGSVSLVVSRGDAVMQPVIKNMKFNASEYAAGEAPSLTFTIENPNAFSLYSVTPTLSGFVDGAVDPVDPDQSFYIEELASYESVSFTVKMKTSEDIAPQIYNFKLDLTAVDDFATSYSSSKSAYFTAVEKIADEFTAQSPRIIVDSFKMSPSNAQPGDTVKLTITLLNLGVLDAENVKVTLGGYDAEFITLREITPEKDIGTVYCQKTATVEYSMTLSSVFPQGQNVPLTVFLSYGDLVGKSYVDQGTINIVSNVPEKTVDEDTTPVYKVPKVIIESFDTDTDLIYAGSEFDLTFTLLNTSEDLTVENLRITLVDSSSSTGVFTPVNSGYSFFMDKIGKNDRHTLSIPLFAKVSTESGIYSLNFQIEYEYYVKTGEKTGEYRSNSLVETISLKIVQPINIEVSNFYSSYYTQANGQEYISFSYNNKSRSNLYFMNIDIEGNATMTDGKLEIGSIPSGYSDYVDFSINIGEETGEQEFAIVFNFKDSLNQESSIRYPFTMFVEEAPSYDDQPTYNDDYSYPSDDYYYPEDDVSDQGDGLSSQTWIIIGAVSAAVVVVITIIIVVVVKKKKAKEEEYESI